MWRGYHFVDPHLLGFLFHLNGPSVWGVYLKDWSNKSYFSVKTMVWERVAPSDGSHCLLFSPPCAKILLETFLPLGNPPCQKFTPKSIHIFSNSKHNMKSRGKFHNLHPSPLGAWGCHVIPRGAFGEPFKYAKSNGYLQIHWKKRSLVGGGVLVVHFFGHLEGTLEM